MRVLAACVWVAVVAGMPGRAGAQSTDPPVKTMKVTVLSTMLVGNAREGVGSGVLPRCSRWTAAAG